MTIGLSMLSKCCCSLVTSFDHVYVNVTGSYTQNRKIMGCYAKDVVPSCCIKRI